MFPVKLTDPVTAILYITYDKQHMEDLRHALHLKEIVEGNFSTIYSLIFSFL
jgi:Uncharacterized conserved protein (DUF2152).